MTKYYEYDCTVFIWKTDFKVMCVVAKRIATNWIIYTNSCVPKHIIYWHYSHRKRNFLRSILKKTLISGHWHLNQNKRENFCKNIMFLTFMGACLIFRNGIIYILNFKKFQRTNSWIGFKYKHFKKIGKKFIKTATEAYSVPLQTSKTKPPGNIVNGLLP